MSATFPAPIKLVLTMTLQDLTPLTGTGKIRTYDIRFNNVGAAEAWGDLVLTDGTTVIHRASNYPVPFKQPGSAPDMELQLKVPAGWKLQALASATLAIEASVTNIVEADLTDFT